MDKNAIKKFAVWARTELIARVSLKGVEYGITEDNIEAANADSVGGKVLTADEKKQRQALIAEINDKSYKQVMEEVAYTWFNRFSALRFMEVNGYLPSHVRVFTDEENNFRPQIITEAIHLDLDGLNMEKVYELKDAEKTEELYKYLLIVQCNALNKVLPGMFQKIADYTELLLPDNLLREGSVIQQMIELIPEADWKDAVQIIGWLYQYYNSEKKDDVFAALKKNMKITKENIPAATQLFTPDWIVRYMVENSLGRLWLEGHPEASEQLLPTEEEQSAYAAGNRDPEDAKWHYYLEEAEQEPEVQAQLAEIRKEYAALTPDQLKVIDPCSGSGHILAYMFDVLMKIYESYGYTTREAVECIVENNLYGLDIDDRAAQLAYFAVMMKARQYDRRFFSRGIQPHVYAIVESNHVDKFAVDYFCNGDAKLMTAMDTIIKELHDAREYGSILTVTQQDWSALYDRFAEVTEDINMSRDTTLRELLPLVQGAEALAQKYDAVVTNPPYMAPTEHQKPYLLKNFKASKNDMAMAFMERNLAFCNKQGYSALIIFPTWMFLASYEKLRKSIVSENTIINMVYPGRGIFGSDFGTTAFVLEKRKIESYKGSYCKLFDAIGEVETAEIREHQFLDRKGYCTFKQDDYKIIPGDPIAFWISDNFLKTFRNKTIGSLCDAKAGIVSGDDDYFLKMWFEIPIVEITFDANNFEDRTAYKWVPINKGGAYRRHYGNYEYVINIYDLWNRQEKVNVSVRRSEPEFYFKKALNWSATTMGGSSFRITNNKTSSTAAPSLYFKNDDDLYVSLALLNSCISQVYMDLLNPTVGLKLANVEAVPAINFEKMAVFLRSSCENNIALSKEDWDSYEISWDFEQHPLVKRKELHSLEKCYLTWKTECENRFLKMKDNEEHINVVILKEYGLENEVSCEVPEKSISVHRIFDTKEDIPVSMDGSYYVRTKRDEIVSLISYSVGCMFGRYSLDKKGIVNAGAPLNVNEYVSFSVDKDNIIPICDDEYFKDDIVGRFVEFIKIVYGADSLDDNLTFIAKALGGKGSPREIIRNYFVNDFYKEHCATYSGTVGKRPIYWLFDAGKNNSFKALIYMHRYQPDTIARIRTDYVHEQQARYRTAIADLEQRIANTSTGERVKLKKKLATLQAQDTEIRTYEEKIHHLADQMISINLDDGVKKNYAIFQDVLAKIK